jgi:hypothetical protein
VQTAVTPANTGDDDVTAVLLADVLVASPEANRAAGTEVYGDAAYGSGETLATLEAAGIEARVKVQPPAAVPGMYSKESFAIDLDAQTVCCPAGCVATIVPRQRGGGIARFETHCATCALRDRCTPSKSGRIVTVHRREALLKRARDRQKSADWKAPYRATRPKVERKLAHIMRRRHGGRRARMRGRAKIGNDFAMLAAATNLARLAVLGVALVGLPGAGF